MLHKRQLTMRFKCCNLRSASKLLLELFDEVERMCCALLRLRFRVVSTRKRARPHDYETLPV